MYVIWLVNRVNLSPSINSGWDGSLAVTSTPFVVCYIRVLFDLNSRGMKPIAVEASSLFLTHVPLFSPVSQSADTKYVIPHLRGGDRESKGSEVPPYGQGLGPSKKSNSDQQVMSV